MILKQIPQVSSSSKSLVFVDEVVAAAAPVGTQLGRRTGGNFGFDLMYSALRVSNVMAVKKPATRISIILWALWDPLTNCGCSPVKSMYATSHGAALGCQIYPD